MRSSRGAAKSGMLPQFVYTYTKWAEYTEVVEGFSASRFMGWCFAEMSCRVILGTYLSLEMISLRVYRRVGKQKRKLKPAVATMISLLWW